VGYYVTDEAELGPTLDAAMENRKPQQFNLHG
jgi:hypothetical protein